MTTGPEISDSIQHYAHDPYGVVPTFTTDEQVRRFLSLEVVVEGAVAGGLYLRDGNHMVPIDEDGQPHPYFPVLSNEQRDALRDLEAFAEEVFPGQTEKQLGSLVDAVDIFDQVKS